jgi:CMP-N,N'-diacetyllegionaminic acid synthase
MYKEQNILCIILARGGSKRLPGKNIKSFHGKPLISYAITAAKECAYIDTTMVSTDDEAIASVAREYGAEVPFMRPAELSSDTATSLSAMQHAVRFYEDQGVHFDLIVLIQPTVPGVLSTDITGLIEKVVEKGSNSGITVSEITDPPAWMYRMSDTGELSSYLPPASDTRSQDLEKLHRVNGAVYVTKRHTLMEQDVIVDKESVVGVLMPRERSVDIDTKTDFKIAETLLGSGL